MTSFPSQNEIKGSYERSKENLEAPQLGGHMKDVQKMASQKGFGEKFNVSQASERKVDQKQGEATERLQGEEERIREDGDRFKEKIKSASFMTNNPS